MVCEISQHASMAVPPIRQSTAQLTSLVLNCMSIICVDNIARYMAAARHKIEMVTIAASRFNATPFKLSRILLENLMDLKF